jgi:YidC/Oxa1 family membrane protein insertase
MGSIPFSKHVMEKRVLLAIFLSFLVLYVYQALVVKPVPKPAANASTPANTAPAARGTAAPEAVAQNPVVPREMPPTPAAGAIVSDPRERTVTVETRDVVAVFTNRGARLESLRLKHYLDPQSRQPQELVAQDLPNQPLPFSLQTEKDQTTRSLNSALYNVSGAPPPSSQGAADLRFEYRDTAGVHAIKQFHFDAASYVITFNATVTEGEKTIAPAIVWGPAIGVQGEVNRYIQASEGLIYPAEASKPQRLAPKDLAKQSVYDGDFRFAGVDDNYFMTIVLAPGPSRVSYQSITIPPPAGSKDPGRALVAYSIEPKQNRQIKFFVGPKDFDVLAGIGPNLTEAINFGMFAVIVVPLLRSLKWVHGFVGNWGWAIVFLTAIINAIMFPLRHKSAVSMRKMQEIQPEVKAIQDRYSKVKATDPAKQKMNQELMALYRERGVNPAAGCVPMLLTFPVLFAMWAMLQTSIELRGAPWFGWIHDLSSHDPYFALPILMGATSFWQQKMMPATGADPAQQKMMMFMPVFMSVMLAWLPAGALIYYIVTNVWTIGQQYLTNYLIGPPNVRTVRPPAERRLKRVGGGKTTEAAANDRAANDR